MPIPETFWDDPARAPEFSIRHHLRAACLDIIALPPGTKPPKGNSRRVIVCRNQDTLLVHQLVGTRHLVKGMLIITDEDVYEESPITGIFFPEGVIPAAPRAASRIVYYKKEMVVPELDESGPKWETFEVALKWLTEQALMEWGVEYALA